MSWFAWKINWPIRWRDLRTIGRDDDSNNTIKGPIAVNKDEQDSRHVGGGFDLDHDGSYISLLGRWWWYIDNTAMRFTRMDDETWTFCQMVSQYLWEDNVKSRNYPRRRGRELEIKFCITQYGYPKLYDCWSITTLSGTERRWINNHP